MFLAREFKSDQNFRIKELNWPKASHEQHISRQTKI
jgi:hypothetical protein